MNEINKYEIYKKKLAGICDEHDLTYSIVLDRYPITLCIRPCDKNAAQLSLIERDAETLNPDAAILMAFVDGDITYQIDDRFTISDTLFTKLKNLFRNMYFCWLQFFFRDIVEGDKLSPAAMPQEEDEDEQMLEMDVPDAKLELIDDEDEDYDEDEDDET